MVGGIKDWALVGGRGVTLLTQDEQKTQPSPANRNKQKTYPLRGRVHHGAQLLRGPRGDGRRLGLPCEPARLLLGGLLLV